MERPGAAGPGFGGGVGCGIGITGFTTGCGDAGGVRGSVEWLGSGWGEVMVCPQLGQGPLIPAMWTGTVNCIPQEAQ